MFKIVVIAALVALVTAQHHGHEEHHVDYYAHPKYEFKYGVHDPHTKDEHEQHEIRDGDVVKGEYSLKEPDGTIRKVVYTSDKHTGFNAIVTRSGHAQHPTHEVHHAPVHHVVAAAPVHHVVAAPVHHVVAAPVHHHVIAAPVVASHASSGGSHGHGHAVSYSNVVAHHTPVHHH